MILTRQAKKLGGAKNLEEHKWTLPKKQVVEHDFLLLLLLLLLQQLVQRCSQRKNWLQKNSMKSWFFRWDDLSF